MLREIMVREFMEKAGQDCEQPLEDIDLLDFRMQLLEEEFLEVKQAVDRIQQELIGWNYKTVSKKAKANLLKELADLQYVLSGFAEAFKLPLSWAFYEVHSNNILKIKTGKINAAGKLEKAKDHPKVDLTLAFEYKG